MYVFEFSRSVPTTILTYPSKLLNSNNFLNFLARGIFKKLRLRLYEVHRLCSLIFNHSSLKWYGQTFLDIQFTSTRSLFAVSDILKWKYEMNYFGGKESNLWSKTPNHMWSRIRVSLISVPFLMDILDNH